MSTCNNSILRLSKVREKTGLSRSAIYDLQSKGLFPQSIKLSPYGSAVGWIESEVHQWIQARIAERDRAA